MKYIAKIRSALKYSVLGLLVLTTLSLIWLRWDAGRSRDTWFSERHGRIETVTTEEPTTKSGQVAESVQLTSDSGLQVSFRIARDAEVDASLPVVMILGGHRTGGDVVELFGDVSHRSVVGVHYPYDGPEKVKGVIPVTKTIPLARQAFLDTVPAVSLIVDWLVEQPWVDRDRIILVGVSLGVPFAATAAARDGRVAGLMLVHGAADNRLWLEAQVARRIDSEILHYPLATLLYWLAYGPVLDTSTHVANVSPRPVVIVGARDDERTPAGQSKLLFDSARDPKRLLYTDGQHIQPDREDIVAELRRIADEELEFLTR